MCDSITARNQSTEKTFFEAIGKIASISVGISLVLKPCCSFYNIDQKREKAYHLTPREILNLRTSYF